MFHQPLTTCMDDFYGRIYNMGGGPAGRIAYHDYLDRLMRLLELGDLRRIVDRDWFCLRNFHCCYFEDSGVLNDYLGHWRQSVDLRQVADEAPWYVALAKLAPSFLVKQLVTKPMARDRNGPLGWIRNRNDGRISAFYGSRDAVAAIPGWEEPIPETPEMSRKSSPRFQ